MLAKMLINQRQRLGSHLPLVLNSHHNLLTGWPLLIHRMCNCAPLIDHVMHHRINKPIKLTPYQQQSTC